MWHDVDHTSNLNLGWDKRGIRAKKSPFFLGLIEREREREEKRERGELKAPFQDLRSFVGRFLSGHEQKFIALISYAWVPRKKDFTEDPRKEISGN